MLILSTRLQVKHRVSSFYRFPCVHNKCPNNGPADYWSLILCSNMIGLVYLVHNVLKQVELFPDLVHSELLILEASGTAH